MSETPIPNQISALERERRVLLRALRQPRAMITGGLVERWVVCGKAGCRCRSGDRHGPYYYRSVLKSGRPRLEYLGKGNQVSVPLLRQYQDYQRGMARLNTIHRELVRLLWQLAEPKLRRTIGTEGVK